MKKAACIVGVFLLLVVCFGVWYTIAANYGDGVASGTYQFAQNGETSTLVLKPDHGFLQELQHSGRTERAEGTWRLFGEGHIAFSKEFLVVSGQELGANGLAYGDIHKALGLFPITLVLSDYDVEWYDRVDPSDGNAVYGIYAGDEEGVPATLVLKPDHTFEQTVNHSGIARHAQGTWSFSQKGDIVFSKTFLKTTGEALRDDETASAWNPKGSNLQIQVVVDSKSGVPTFRKKYFPW